MGALAPRARRSRKLIRMSSQFGTKATRRILIAVAWVTLSLFVLWLGWWGLNSWLTPRVHEDKTAAPGPPVDSRVVAIQLAAALVVASGLVYSARTYSLTQATQRATAFSNALQHLSNADSEFARIGGIYALSMLVEQDHAYWSVIQPVLETHVRSRDPQVGIQMQEVLLALQVLGRRRRKWTVHTERLDLRGVDLSGAQLAGLNFVRARFDGAVLRGARFTDSDLRGARLDNVIADDAEFSGAKMEQVSAVGASLNRCGFDNAKVTGMNVEGASLISVRGLRREQALQLRGYSAV